VKSSRNIRKRFRTAAMQRRTFSVLSAGIVMVVMISLVASAQTPSAAPADDKSIRFFQGGTSRPGSNLSFSRRSSAPLLSQFVSKKELSHE
jgi:hypothetical protein